MWMATITLAGSAGKSVNLNYELTGADYAAAAANLAAIQTALAAATEAEILKTRLSEITEVSTTLPLDVDVAIVGTMTGKINGTNKSVVVRFPAPAVREGTTGDAYNELDLDPTSGAANRDYWALFGPGGQATISDGEATSVSGPRSSQIVSKASRMP